MASCSGTGGSPELAALEPDLNAAMARRGSARIVSIGTAPAVQGQVVTFLGENARIGIRVWRIRVMLPAVPISKAKLPDRSFPGLKTSSVEPT